MPFNQLVNEQQIEAAVGGPTGTTAPGANRLYLCSGLAQGHFSLGAQAGQYQTASDPGSS